MERAPDRISTDRRSIWLSPGDYPYHISREGFTLLYHFEGRRWSPENRSGDEDSPVGDDGAGTALAEDRNRSLHALHGNGELMPPGRSPGRATAFAVGGREQLLPAVSQTAPPR